MRSFTNISKLFSDQHLHLFRIVIICSAHTIELIIISRNAHNGKLILCQFRILHQQIWVWFGLPGLCLFPSEAELLSSVMHSLSFSLSTSLPISLDYTPKNTHSPEISIEKSIVHKNPSMNCMFFCCHTKDRPDTKTIFHLCRA